MQIDDCFYLGYIQKSIGHKGELAFKLDVDSPSLYQNIDGVFLQKNPKDTILVPYFIEKAILQHQILRVKIENVNDQQLAKEFIGNSIYLPLTLLPPLSGNQFYFHEIIGYQTIDKDKGPLGPINKVLEYSTSNVFSITHETGKEVLVPISDLTIDKVDRANKTIYLNCPEGLIDLYLE